jgi:hypothetical protein
MKYSIKLCLVEGCNNPRFSNGCCKNHTIRKPLLSNSTIPYKRKTEQKPLKDLDIKLEMRNLFLKMWNEKPHISEISGINLGSVASSAFFHHILPKSKYSKGMLDEENIIILSMDEHNNVENDMYKYEEINKRRELLKIKYNLN